MMVSQESGTLIIMMPLYSLLGEDEGKKTGSIVSLLYIILCSVNKSYVGYRARLSQDINFIAVIIII